jgi:hypothetical protein
MRTPMAWLENSPREDARAQGTHLQPRQPSVRYALGFTLFAAGGYLVYEATQHWFYLDEWDFLGYRSVRLSKRGIFYPHAGHWTTIPILIWRGLFNVVGVRDYWLYSLPLILGHLAVVYLIWRIMLRHRVEPWTATLLAAAFAVLGVGAADLTRAFQVTFVGSVALGLLAIDAIECERLWLAIISSVCALMFSNVGVLMVVACGIVALARRRPGVAAAVTIPSALTFLIWYELIGHSGTQSANFSSGNVAGLASYVWTGLSASLAGFVDAPQVVGSVLVIVLAAAAMLYRNVPAALALSVAVIYGFLGLGRLQLGVNQASASRYSYIALALLLPLIGQLVSDLVRSVRVRPLVMSLLVALIGVNAVVLFRYGTSVKVQEAHERNQIEAAAYLIHRGDRFPGVFPTSSEFGPPNMPTVPVLAVMIKRGQFPLPQHVSPESVLIERDVLGAFASDRRGYGADLTFIAPHAAPCASVNVRGVSRVELSVSGSLRLATHPKTLSSFTVTFAPDTFAVVPVDASDHWLNVSRGLYPTAFISASRRVLLCG